MNFSALSFAFVLSTFAFATGCTKNDSVDAFCDRLTEAGCSVSGGGRDKCVETFGEIANTADDRGCRSDFDAYLECSADVLSNECTAGTEKVQAACPQQTEALARCDAR